MHKQVGNFQDYASSSHFLLSTKDPLWSKLRIWIDENRNGNAEPEELHRLEEFGIHSISAKAAVSYWDDEWGNNFIYTAPLNIDADEVERWYDGHDKMSAEFEPRGKGKVLDTQTYDVKLRSNKYVSAIKDGNDWKCPGGYGNISFGDPPAIPTCERMR
jgi:hypothetical protein